MVRTCLWKVLLNSTGTHSPTPLRATAFSLLLHIYSSRSRILQPSLFEPHTFMGLTPSTQLVTRLRSIPIASAIPLMMKARLSSSLTSKLAVAGQVA